MKSTLSETETSATEDLLSRYRRVRSRTEALARPITAEDAQLQSMADASPTKWHLGHTTWFFETFVLGASKGYRPFREEYRVLFNSYYNAVGDQHPRAQRGLLSRPSLDEVYEYRHAVDAAMEDSFESGVSDVILLGLHHEQQHQELLMTDILHAFWSNPMRPRYREGEAAASPPAEPLAWHVYPEAVRWIGHEGPGFAFDNETPRHREFVHGFEIASRLVTAGEYLEFIAERGYERPELWLSDGFETVRREGWAAPLYWDLREGTWWQMTLHGMRPVDENDPVCHVSYYEADAYARFREARLPTEAEWEVAAAEIPIEGNFQEAGALSPRAPDPSLTDEGPKQMYGDLWEWTQSAYLPYPGYRPGAGALGEYNAKFMCNQMVLRGGSFVTPRDHIRSTYRNFFYPQTRWQFMGIRLAKDA